ncbi:hypothetical protein [Orientia tsutsugamushi]|uniref:hypothetical protein n=1 Tax=Orientia tsutsugamushi TaxID=784 RepID=UPI000D5A45F7|nr:reverse transcriptase [Orientia tsutsugamushi]
MLCCIGVETSFRRKVSRLLLWSLITREFDETLKVEKQMMVVNFTASASTDNKMHLHSINWKKCNKVVRSHQTCIVMNNGCNGE